MTRSEKRSQRSTGRAHPSRPTPPNPHPSAARRVLSVGSVLRRTFAMWRSDAGSFACVFLAVNAPMLLISAWIYASPQSWSSRVRTYGAAVALGTLLLETVAAGATAHGTLARLAGKAAGLRACLAVGASRFGRLLGVAGRIYLRVLGLGTVLFVLAIAASYACGFAGPASQLPPFAVWASVTIVFVVPTLLVALRYGVAAPLCIAEACSAGDALRGARELQQGNRWPMLGIVAILWTARLSISVLISGTLGGASLSEIAGHPGALSQAADPVSQPLAPLRGRRR